VADKARHQVVVLYEHSLLGEGIASIVLAETGTRAIVVPAADRRAVEAAVAGGPAVVIFERSPQLGESDVARLAPHATLIDVSSAMSTGTVGSRTNCGLDRIIEAVRGVRNSRGMTTLYRISTGRRMGSAPHRRDDGRG
jgi:hypothetical protein